MGADMAMHARMALVALTPRPPPAEASACDWADTDVHLYGAGTGLPMSRPCPWALSTYETQRGPTGRSLSRSGRTPHAHLDIRRIPRSACLVHGLPLRALAPHLSTDLW